MREREWETEGEEKRERRWVGQSHSSGPANLSMLVLQAQRPECTRNQWGILPDNEAFSLQTNIQLVAFICPPVWRTLQHITALISSAHKVKYEVRLTGKRFVTLPSPDKYTQRIILLYHLIAYIVIFWNSSCDFRAALSFNDSWWLNLTGNSESSFCSQNVPQVWMFGCSTVCHWVGLSFKIKCSDTEGQIKLSEVPEYLKFLICLNKLCRMQTNHTYLFSHFKWIKTLWNCFLMLPVEGAWHLLSPLGAQSQTLTTICKTNLATSTGTCAPGWARCFAFLLHLRKLEEISWEAAFCALTGPDYK